MAGIEMGLIRIEMGAYQMIRCHRQHQWVYTRIQGVYRGVCKGAYRVYWGVYRGVYKGGYAGSGEGMIAIRCHPQCGCPLPRRGGGWVEGMMEVEGMMANM